MLTPPAHGTVRRKTLCGRASIGGGMGVQIMTFPADPPQGEFEATEIAPAVTCKRCIERLNAERDAAMLEEQQSEIAYEEQQAEERRRWEEAEMARHYSLHPHG